MITDKWMASKPTGVDQYEADDAPRGTGHLEGRITPAGSRLFLFRYTGPDGKRVRLNLGRYHPRSVGGLSLSDARAKATELALLYREHKDLRGYLERQQIEAEDKRKADAEAAAAKAREEEANRGAGTLGKLMDAYVEHLRQQKKPSYADTRNLVRLHIHQAHADLCQRKASEITASELRKVINLVKDAGHLRTSAKVRSYLRAAFALGVGAEGNTNLPESFMGFGIDSNPAAALSPIKRNSVPGERALSISELQSYIRRVNELESPVTKRALLLALYLGGQRMEQLLHVRRSDINLSEGLVCLRDGKGKRDVPRLHWLPLSEQTAGWFSELLAMNSPETGLLFSMDGVRPMVAVTASKAVARIAAAMVKSGETDSESSRFKMIDIRRTCETQLARLKISKDIRAQLLSHGLGGVQDRHYDQHTYLDEKRLALATWEQFLAGEGQISADVLRFVRAA